MAMKGVNMYRLFIKYNSNDCEDIYFLDERKAVNEFFKSKYKGYKVNLYLDEELIIGR